MDGTKSHWDSLERWSPRLFLLAGAVLAVYGAVNGMNAFTEASVDPKAFEVGYVAGFLGLLGLYPRFADRSPRLASVGAGAAVLGLVAFSVFTVNRLAEFAGVASGDPPGWLAFTVMAATGFVVGFLSFGVAALRDGVHPRTVGLVLLVPAIIIVLMFAHMAVGWDSPVTVFVVSAGQGMAHLAIGATLETAGEATDREEAEAASDATARG